MSGNVRTTRDDRLLLALACGASLAKAAQEAGVNERTVRRRMADQGFRTRLFQLRGETLERAGGALTAAALKAVTTLVALLEGSQPAAVRLGAARAVLDMALRVREMTELELRLKALEDQLASTTSS
jgi:hypothetical protein